ncbi:hypothetical protein POM88_008053 [Heracleum sosnowskyi]|uniref:Myb/SANT-like domain-containing protein n=1 Tax=Heracleum sosnowskyi TaxID=360622 RepID=A0AAD8N1D7_9APIA|nr:hypothetical protein POM88_008053 [Heracleum sosnowskyi]
MDANSQSTNGSTNGERGRNKGFWKKTEEEALIDFLLVMSTDQQWKGEGGFKNGYLNHSEVMMQNKFPGSDLRVFPHFDSKVKWFKNKYGVICEMLDLIFGVDRANGTSSEFPEDSIQNLEETVNLDNDYSFMKDMSSHLATIVKSMNATQDREIKVVEQKKKLLTEIASLPGITQAEAIRAASFFSSNPSQMEDFFSSPNDLWKKEVMLDITSRNH